MLASSRFTIPVSLILPVDEATSDLPSAILRLLELRYPELELIVVIENQPDALETLKMACDLTPVRAVLPPDAARPRRCAGSIAVPASRGSWWRTRPREEPATRSTAA